MYTSWPRPRHRKRHTGASVRLRTGDAAKKRSARTLWDLCLTLSRNNHFILAPKLCADFRFLWYETRGEALDVVEGAHVLLCVDAQRSLGGVHRRADNAAKHLLWRALFPGHRFLYVG